MRSALILLLAIAGCASPPRPPAPSLDWVAWTASRGVVAPDRALDTAMPTVVALHGLGDNPQHFLGLFAELDGVRVLAPAAPLPWPPDGFSWFEHRLTEDPAGASAEIPGRAEAVAGLIRWAHAHPAIIGKPVVTGFSQGGVLSYAVALHHADLIAGAVPIAGLLPTEAIPASTPGATAPIRAVHGDADTRLAFSEAERTVSALQKLGFDATLDRFDGVGHSIPPVMRSRVHDHVRTLLALPPR